MHAQCPQPRELNRYLPVAEGSDHCSGEKDRIVAISSPSLTRWQSMALKPVATRALNPATLRTVNPEPQHRQFKALSRWNQAHIVRQQNNACMCHQFLRREKQKEIWNANN